MTMPSCSPAVSRWLLLCMALIVCMVMLGGYTRLSGSGLSITHWKLLHGTIPPLNEGEWQEEFASYRLTPQYAQVNAGMNLEEFKQIYWPEYLHRLLGRIIGLVFVAPLIAFWYLKKITPRFTLRMLAIFALGGLQGGIGWIMVASGLVDQPYVSHVRLALHLGMAFILFALILWAWLDIREPWRESPPLPRWTKYAATGLLALLFLQILYGAFVAGLHAGLVYNTFPTMNGKWMPEEVLTMQPIWRNFLENVPAVQFVHRWLAAIWVGLAVLFACYLLRRGPFLRSALLCLIGIAALQFLLGVATLLMIVPLALALAHQLNALLLFAIMVTITHGLLRGGNISHNR